jgi:hypothetical protein
MYKKISKSIKSEFISYFCIHTLKTQFNEKTTHHDLRGAVCASLNRSSCRLLASTRNPLPRAGFVLPRYVGLLGTCHGLPLQSVRDARKGGQTMSATISALAVCVTAYLLAELLGYIAKEIHK